ncbi:MAG TPA: hypothetical protein VKT77_13790, partial [Chthonomonadaceae bacterium]|nr:hypothetical protein [Chthonomonadaceae bacterium]
MLRSLCIATLILLAAPAATADAARDDGLGSEPKFDRKVEVAAEGVPVGDLLATISKKTGLALRADPGVADDKIVLFGPPRPLRAVLGDIAAVYNDSWRHYTNVEKVEQYVLYREPKAFRYENGLVQALAARRMAKLDQQVAALDENEAQFARRPEMDWVRRNFAKPILHGRTATRLYSLLDAGQKQALFAQGYLNVSFAATGETTKKTVRQAFEEAVGGLVKENERVQQENPNVHIVIDDPQNLAQYGVRFNLHHENNAGLSALVVQIILGKASYMTMGEFDADSQWLLPAHGNPYDRRPVAAGAELPAEADTLAAARIRDWIDALHALADRTGRPILADYYRAPALVKPLPDDSAAPASRAVQGAIPPIDADFITTPAHPAASGTGRAGGATGAARAPRASAALDMLCEPAGYLWWVADGGALLLRKRDWYEQQRYEPSDRWMRDVAARVARQKGVPTYGDLGALLALTPAQLAGLNNLLAGGGGTPDDVDTIAGVPELLRVASALTDPAAPIFVGDLSPDTSGRIAMPQRGVPPALRGQVADFLA